jgi:hypothetical protein
VACDKFRDFSNQISIAIGQMLLTSQRTNDFRLPFLSNLAVAGKRRHDTFMPKVLRPSLEFLRRLANLLPEQGEGLTEGMGMGIEIPEPHSLESRSENRPNRCGVRPTLTIEPGDFKMTARTKCDARRRKERIVEPPKPLLLQKTLPIRQKWQERPRQTALYCDNRSRSSPPHAFEHALNKLLNLVNPELGGFNHYEHGVDVIRYLEGPYHVSPATPFAGLNLTAEISECVLKHTYCHEGDAAARALQAR